jgi:hypothetical protein
MSSIGWSRFARERHRRGTGNSFFTLTEQQVLDRVAANWAKRTPGTGEIGIDRKVLVPVDPQGFFIASVALQDGLPLRAEVVRRQPHEDPYVEIYIDEADAARLGLQPQEAKHCNIVCYSKEALLENDGERTTDDDWEIVSVNASLTEVDHMPPLTMARNMLEKAGGTKSVYTAEEFAEAVYANSQRGVKIKSSFNTMALAKGEAKLTPQQIRNEMNRLKQIEREMNEFGKRRFALQRACKHEFAPITNKADMGYAKCIWCDETFGWRCDKSPDGVCHCVADGERDGQYLVTLIDGRVVESPSHQPDGETCLFCGEYDERK